MNVIIDLHGVKHEHVESIVYSACIEHEAPFIVITGKSDTMKRLVASAVKSMGYTIRDAYDNPGRVVIE